MTKASFTIESLFRPAYALLAVMAVTLLSLSVWAWTQQPEQAAPYHAMQHAPQQKPEELTDFADIIRGIIASDEEVKIPPAYRALFDYPLHVELWHDKQMVGEAMALGEGVKPSIEQLRQSFAQLRLLPRLLSGDEVLSLTFFYNPQPQERTRSQREMAEFVTPALHGIYFRCRETGMLMPNFRWVSHELRDVHAAANTYMQWMGCDRDAISGGYGSITRFDTTQWVQLKAGAAPQLWMRAKYPVSKDVTVATISELKQQNIAWLMAHIEPSGKLPYIIRRNMADMKDNQLIRQWLVSVALGREAQVSGAADIRDAFLRNLRYNLQHYRVEQADRLFFSLDGKGGWTAANSIAAEALRMALAYDASLERDYRKILNALMVQWTPQGEINGFISTSEDAYPNFSDGLFLPGATMLALLRAEEAGTIQLPEGKIQRSFEHYATRWREGSKPPAPWLILAAAEMLRHTPDDASLAQTLFAMADRMVQCQNQQADGKSQLGALSQCGDNSVLYLSTAMHIEGLVTAYDWARKTGDTERQTRYQQAVTLAYQHVFQGQAFAANSFHIDTSYLQNTVPYNEVQSHVRVDAAPHVSLAAQLTLDKMLQDE